MSENRTAEQSAEIRKVDITDIIDRFLHSLKRRWWAVLILTILVCGYRYFRVSSYQNEVYVATETLSVSATSAGQNLGSDSYTNVTTASQLGKVANILISNGMLNSAIKDDMGLDYMPASISASSIDNTNLLTITATGSDAQQTYDTLQAAIRQLPNVAQSIVGQIYTETLIPAEVPENSGREVVIRGSARKGAMMGFALGMLVVLIDMLMWRTVTHTSDVQSLLNIQSMGKLPVVKGKKRRKSKIRAINIMDKRTSADYQESIRAIRARVERRMEKLGAKTFLVTSSIPSEGKSTVSANLALAFAKKGKRTILIDCDFRHPSLQGVLGIEGDFPGLEKVLKGEATLEQALYRFDNGSMDLYVIPGAKEVSENIDILGSETMKQLIKQLEEVCDVLILDTSPSAMLADALNLAKVVPMALYVIRCEFAQVKHILHGVTELEDTGIKMIGCVLNYSKTGSKGKSASTNYGYGNYGSYGYGKYGYGKNRRNKNESEDDDTFLSDVSFAEHSLGAVIAGAEAAANAERGAAGANVYAAAEAASASETTETTPASVDRIDPLVQLEPSDKVYSTDHLDQAEQIRLKEAAAARIAAEQAKAQIEADRAAAEQAKAQIEAERAAAEQAWAQIEAERAAAEQAKAQIEAERAAAEQAKAQIEAERTAAEKSWAQIEAERASAEAAAAEQTRLKEEAEAARNQMEAYAAEQARLREEAEAALKAAEAEAARLSAERQAMEAARRDAEAAAQAETERLNTERQAMEAAAAQANAENARRAARIKEAADAVRRTELQDVEKKLEKVNRSIQLLEIIQKYRPVFREYQGLRESEKVAYARQHITEMRDLTSASKELSTMYESGKLPRLDDLKEEKDFLTVKRRDLRK